MIINYAYRSGYLEPVTNTVQVTGETLIYGFVYVPNFSCILYLLNTYYLYRNFFFKIITLINYDYHVHLYCFWNHFYDGKFTENGNSCFLYIIVLLI